MVSPSFFVKLSVSEGGVITLSANDCESIGFIGATIPTPLLRQGMRSRALHLTLPKGYKGLLAFSVFNGRTGSGRTLKEGDYHFIVPLESDRMTRDNPPKPQPVVLYSNEVFGSVWTPKADRLGQITLHGYIEVPIGGVTYTTWPQGAKAGGFAFVPDASLMLRYLAGDEGVDGQTLEAAATEHAEEVSARQQLPQMTELCNTLGQYLREIAVSCGLIPAATFLGTKSEIIAKVTDNFRDRYELQQTVLRRREEIESYGLTAQQALRSIGREREAVDLNVERLIGKLFAAYVEDIGALKTRLAALEGAFARLARACGKNWLQSRPLLFLGAIRNLLTVAREQGLLPGEAKQ